MSASTTITDGTVHVFTFKEGLLSRVAHDLRLTVGGFELQIEAGGATLRGTFQLGSLRVDGAMVNGSLKTGSIRDKDLRDIKKNIDQKILDTRRWPTAQVEATHEGGRLEGTLQLKGRSASISCSVTHTDGRLRGRVILVPTRWGIKPFKAALGTIKLKDRIEVAFDLPVPS